MRTERIKLEAAFNEFKYSDAESIAKADSQFHLATAELDSQKVLTVQYQEKLERQNSKFMKLIDPLYFDFFVSKTVYKLSIYMKFLQKTVCRKLNGKNSIFRSQLFGKKFNFL